MQLCSKKLDHFGVIIVDREIQEAEKTLVQNIKDNLEFNPKLESSTQFASTVMKVAEAVHKLLQEKDSGDLDKLIEDYWFLKQVC